LISNNNQLKKMNSTKITLKIIILFCTTILFIEYNYLIAQNVGIGEATFTPDANAMLEVQSDNKGLLPPRVELIETINFAPLSAHVEGMVVYNTATVNDVVPGLYVNDGAKWISLTQTGSSSGSCPTLQIGDTYGGGKVIATNYPTSECGYLISALTDQSTNSEWGCYGTFIGGTSRSYGFGKHNSDIIFGLCNWGAVKTCFDYTITEAENTYQDWFLPSAEELSILFRYRNIIGEFNLTSTYWSSTENPENLYAAWRQTFSNMGGQSVQSKNNTPNRIRCVRAF